MSPICASVSASHVKSGCPQNVLHGVLLSHVREAMVPEMCFSLFSKMAISKVSLQLSMNLSKAKTGVRALSWLSWNSNSFQMWLSSSGGPSIFWPGCPILRMMGYGSIKLAMINHCILYFDRKRECGPSFPFALIHNFFSIPLHIWYFFFFSGALIVFDKFIQSTWFPSVLLFSRSKCLLHLLKSADKTETYFGGTLLAYWSVFGDTKIAYWAVWKWNTFWRHYLVLSENITTAHFEDTFF